MAERAGAEVDAGDAAHVGVVAERATEAGIRIQLLGWEEVETGQQRVERHGRVSLAEQEAVASRPVRLASP